VPEVIEGKGKTGVMIRAGLLAFCGMLASCGFRGKLDLDPQSREFYETARLIMTGPEKDIFQLLPDRPSRDEFIRDFWAKRDPDPETEENEFKEEFFRRISFANKRFLEGIPGWKTDRGRIYIYLGPPDKVESRPYINHPQIKGLIWWGYYRHRLGIEFVDRTGDGRYTFSRQVGAAGGLLEAIERAKFGQVYRGQGDFRDLFRKFEATYIFGEETIRITLPTAALSFRAEGDQLILELEFTFFVYSRKKPGQEKFQRKETLVFTEGQALEMEEVGLSFPHALEPGDYYLDVTVRILPDAGKIRKIFRIKI